MIIYTKYLYISLFIVNTYLFIYIIDFIKLYFKELYR